MEKEGSYKNTVLEIAKWLIGTVGLGLTGIFINQQIQKTELEIKRLEADANFLSVVTQDVKNRADSSELGYLQFIHTFITTPQIKNEVRLRIGDLSRHMDESSARQAKNTAEKQQEVLVDHLSEQEKQAFLKMKTEENAIDENSDLVSIDQLKVKENRIAPDKNAIDLGIIHTLNETKKIITPLSISSGDENYTLIGTPVSKWCKQGYYVEFNNSLRVGVVHVDKQSMVFNLKDIDGENKTAPTIIPNNTSVSLSEGGVYAIDHQNYRYLISLNYIGAAGKNPFTQAACFTVSTYKKSR
ncbi:hypothetical protein N6H18_15080 [Reichenbachiella agarivorans]|uniref:Uncharacterized protein n=1 Tax=Reichenbachiella agarivorans TaxID=2979464 RepID=A0ABY6CME4_9BACT|nr:hypothetical protein [Reichenbachiella agarivorans]UXP31671.1 hypothetical protein N6H18_15080 [Reichenbachiella agarivorans]